MSGYTREDMERLAYKADCQQQKQNTDALLAYFEMKKRKARESGESYKIKSAESSEWYGLHAILAVTHTRQQHDAIRIAQRLDQLSKELLK